MGTERLCGLEKVKLSTSMFVITERQAYYAETDLEMNDNDSHTFQLNSQSHFKADVIV